MSYEININPSTLVVLATWLLLIASNWIAWRRSRRRIVLGAFLALCSATAVLSGLVLIDLGIQASGALDDPHRFEGVEFPLFLVGRMIPNALFLSASLTVVALLSCIPSSPAPSSPKQSN